MESLIKFLVLKSNLLVGGFTALLFGLVFSIVFLPQAVSKYDTNIFTETDGVVSSLEPTKQSMLQGAPTIMCPRIKYFFNSQQKEFVSNKCDDTVKLKTGDKVKVIVYKNYGNNFDIVVPGIDKKILPIVFGVIFVIVGLTMLIPTILTGIKLYKLKKLNTSTMAKIIEIRPKQGNFKINKQVAYYVIAEGQNPITGKTEKYKSTSFWQRPAMIEEDLKYKVGQSVVVYLDPTDSTKYYVEL